MDLMEGQVGKQFEPRFTRINCNNSTKWVQVNIPQSKHLSVSFTVFTLSVVFRLNNLPFKKYCILLLVYFTKTKNWS